MALPNVMDTMKAINIARIQVDNGITLCYGHNESN